MAALGLDLTGNTTVEKVTNDPHSDDDADSDFDDGGSQKRRPRVQRAEDLEDGAEPPTNTQREAWELSPPKDSAVDLWAEPANQTGDAPAGDRPKNHERRGSKSRGTRGGSDSRGSRGGSDTRGGRGSGRGRGSNDRGRGTAEKADRGRGAAERGRGTSERGERGRGGRGKGRGGSVPAKKEESGNEAKSPTAENTTTDGIVASKADADTSTSNTAQPATGEGQKKKGKSSSSSKPAEAWELPPVSPAEQDAGWGIDPSESTKPTAGAEEWGDAGWGESGGASNGNKKNADGNKQVKRPPAYINPDRVKTGGSERTKLTDEELAQKMEKIRLQNEKIKEKRLEVVADEEKFAAEQLAVKQKQEAEAKKQTDINRERQKIAEKKIAQAQNREWDTGKPGISDRANSFEGRGRGRGRGRGDGGRGRGRGSSGPSDNQNAAETEETPAE